MSKIHYFQRYSSQENTVTNNTLQLLARIYDYSPYQASKLLTDLTGESIEIGIEIKQQEPTKNAVPDGAIIQRSFKILVESKVDSGVNEEQLLRHIEDFTHEVQKILILLTKQPIGKVEEKSISRKISEKAPDVVFKNITYKAICDAAKELFKEYEYEMYALIGDYVDYCNDMGLFDQSKYLMRMVPCGKSIELNQKYGIYFSPKDRGYTKHSYTGIYANRSVHCIWENESVFDIEFDGSILTKKELIEGRNTDDYDQNIIDIIKDAALKPGYLVASGHRFFCGNRINTDYKKASSGGILGARFVNLKDVLGDYTDTLDIATKLKDQKWV